MARGARVTRLLYKPSADAAAVAGLVLTLSLVTPALASHSRTSAPQGTHTTPAATHTKGKHAAHHESKSSHKTPEVQAPPSGGASSAPTTQAAQPIAPPSAPAP